MIFVTLGGPGHSRREFSILWRHNNNKSSHIDSGSLHPRFSHWEYQGPIINTGAGGNAWNNWLHGGQAKCLDYHPASKIPEWKLWCRHIDTYIPHNLHLFSFPNLPPCIHSLHVHRPGGHSDRLGPDILWWLCISNITRGGGDCGLKWEVQWHLSWENWGVSIYHLFQNCN